MGELVADAMRGKLRVPGFQRGLRWESADVAMLLDSMFRGYPVGSLLLWRRPQPIAGPAQLGPILVQDPATDDVRWIVDGQQRVTALAVSLSKHAASDPRFDVWFDPDGKGFHPRPRSGPELHWIPVWRLLDAADLGEFLISWPQGTPDRRRTVLEAGKRIRDFQIPTYVIETDDDHALREIFRRTNRLGKQLRENEVFDALAGSGGSLEDLGRAVASLGWGEVEADVLLKAVLTNEALDPTRTLEKQTGDVNAATSRGAVRVQAALLATVEFLRTDAGIPHQRLLPYNVPLQVLPAFFDRHREPTARSRRLLARWVWRSFFWSRPNDPVLIRAAVRAVVDGDRTEDERVQMLLSLVPTAAPTQWTVEPGKRFRSDSATQRIGLLGLASLAPVDVETLAPLDIAAVLNDKEGDATRAIIEGGYDGELRFTLANRAIQPGHSDLAEAFAGLAATFGVEVPALASHAIDPLAARSLLSGDHAIFLERRRRAIERVVADRLLAYAGWDQDDRPNLRSVFAK